MPRFPAHGHSTPLWSDPATASAVRAAAATGAIHSFAEKDALRNLGTGYFGAGEAGEKAFAGFTQNLVQWRAFGDTRAYGMMMQGATRHFERAGYSQQDARLKASGVIAEASADPTFAKLIANSFTQEQMLRNDLTAAGEGNKAHSEATRRGLDRMYGRILERIRALPAVSVA